MCDGKTDSMVMAAEGTVLGVVVDALATYRLTRLVVEDEIAAPLRDRVWARDDPGMARIGYLVTCPWCVSFWVAVAVVAARRAAPGPWGLAARVLAFSAVTGAAANRI